MEIKKMAFKKEELINQSIKAIKSNEILFIEELVSYLPCSMKTFYNYKLQDLQDIKEQLERNRILKKIELRNKWYYSENATLQIALYKLLANENEYKRLTNNHNETSSQVIEPIKIVIQTTE